MVLDKTTAEQVEPLQKAIQQLEEEARMILPGIQALFGFQLIAVFNQRFTELIPTVQSAHFVALLMSAVAMLFVMTPAAYHRQAEPRRVSERLARVGTFCLTVCLFPLSVGTAIDVFVIANLLKYTETLSYAVAVATFVALFTAWFVFPRTLRRILK